MAVAHPPIVYGPDDKPDFYAIAEQVAAMDPLYLEAFQANTEVEKWEITKLHSRHREILRLLVLGHSNKEIADMLGCTAQTVSNVRGSKLAQAKLEELHGVRDEHVMDVQKRIKNLSGLSVDVLEEYLLDDTLPKSLKAKIAQDLLDRAGHSRIAKVQADINHSILSKEDLASLRDRAREAGAITEAQALQLNAPAIIDAEPLQQDQP